MTESTKRTTRTIYQVLLTLAIAVPVLLAEVPPHTPVYTVLAGFAAALVAVTKAVTLLEDRGILPAFLRNVEPRYDVVDDVASAAADAAAVAPMIAAQAGHPGTADQVAGDVAKAADALRTAETQTPAT